MKFWQNISWMETGQILEIARFAEELGFEGLLNGDHGVFPDTLKTPYPYAPDGKPPMSADWEYPDCWVSGTAMCAVTTRLKFASCIYVLPIRNPFEVARATGTGAMMTGNRLIMGVSAGWMREEFEAFGVEYETRGARLDEMIEVLRKLWSAGGKAVEHHGRFFDFEPLHISPCPGYDVPVYIGGASKPALRRAARLGDGWMGGGNTPEEAVAILAELKRLRREAGRDHLPFETIVPLTTPPDIDTFRRLEDQGMTSAVAYPYLFSLGKLHSTVDEKKRAMEQYAKAFIEPMRR
jgi:probable F420-dependent oxidoreductase